MTTQRAAVIQRLQYENKFLADIKSIQNICNAAAASCSQYLKVAILDWVSFAINVAPINYLGFVYLIYSDFFIFAAPKTKENHAASSFSNVVIHIVTLSVQIFKIFFIAHWRHRAINNNLLVPVPLPERYSLLPSPLTIDGTGVSIGVPLWSLRLVGIGILDGVAEF